MRTFSLFFFCLFTLLACQTDTKEAASVNGATAQRLENSTFEQKLKSINNALLIDVRTPQEFQAGNIEGAINYNYHDEDFNQKLQALDKNQPTFIYCQSGGRSGKTLARMKKMGFKTVYELKTGYSGWTEK